MKRAPLLWLVSFTLAGCATALTGYQWYKAEEPQSLIAWIVVDAQRLQQICGRPESIGDHHIACTAYPRSIYGVFGGAVVYSIYTIADAHKVRECDGSTLYEHEARHWRDGLAHTGTCIKSVFDPF